METYTLPNCTKRASENINIPLSLEAPLSEHLPGIYKIVGVKGQVDSLTYSLENGVFSLRGNAHITVMYLAENGLLRCTAFDKEFEKSLDMSILASLPSTSGSPTLIVTAEIPSASAKMRGARLVEIHAALMVDIGVYECEDTLLVNPENTPDVFLHTDMLRVVSHKKYAAPEETLHTEILLEPNMPAISEILDTRAVISFHDLTAKEDGLYGSGTACLEMRYRAESDGENAPEYIDLTKEIPFEAAFHDVCTSPDAKVIGNADVSQISATSGFDAYGECRKMVCDVGYRAYFDLFSEGVTQIADDGYSPSYECDFVYETLPYESTPVSFSETVHVEESLRFDGDRNTFTEISSANAQIFDKHIAVFEDGVYFDGRISVGVTGYDEKGEITKSTAVFPVHLPLKMAGDNLQNRLFAFTAALSGVQAVIREGGVVFRAEIGIHGMSTEKRKVRALTKADVQYDRPKPVCAGEYIVYYPENGEMLWEIAKRYEVSEECIRKENSISGDVVDGRKTLCIPCGKL